jgi:hypothetical protein
MYTSKLVLDQRTRPITTWSFWALGLDDVLTIDLQDSGQQMLLQTE